MDKIFYISLFFIIVTGLISTFIKSRKKDRCLLDFKDFEIILTLDGQKEIFGIMAVFSSALELRYKAVHKDSQGHDETSYILFNNEFSRINHIRRNIDKLTPLELEEREKDIYNTFHRVAWEKMKRKIKNVFASIRDYVIRAFEMSMGQIKKTLSPGSIIVSQDKYITEMGKNIIGYTGNAYEPVYEELIGSKVVVEFNDDRRYEYCGVLKEYSESFIEILDAEYACSENKEKSCTCDIIFPRTKAVIRHRG